MQGPYLLLDAFLMRVAMGREVYASRGLASICGNLAKSAPTL